MAYHQTIACLNKCKRIAVKRGLCYSCYEGFAQKIRLGKLTWAELEAQGLSAPRPSKKQRSQTYHRYVSGWDQG